MLRKLALIAGIAWVARTWFDSQSSANNARTQPEAPPSSTTHTPAEPLPDAIAAEGPGHVPTDLLTDAHPDGSRRADDHFRPDPTAPVTEEDRESLRPVTAPAPHDPPGR